MANYTPITDFAGKDELVSGDPLKVVRGAEIMDEFLAIEAAIISKANSNNPVFTGTVTLPAVDGLTLDGGLY